MTATLAEIIARLESPHANLVFVAKDYSKADLIADLRATLEQHECAADLSEADATRLAQIRKQAVNDPDGDKMFLLRLRHSDGTYMASRRRETKALREQHERLRAVVAAARAAWGAFCEHGEPERKQDDLLPEGYWSPAARMLGTTAMIPVRDALAALAPSPAAASPWREIAEAAAHHLAGYDGDLVSRPAKDLRARRGRLEQLLREAGLYPPLPSPPASEGTKL